MTTTQTDRDAQTLQLWPNGDSVTFSGDSAPGSKNLQVKAFGATKFAKWQPATEKERHAIRREELARVYENRDVLCCDSALVDELLKLGTEMGRPGDLESEFNVDNIHGLYPDPDDWGVSECREWLDENGHKWPITPEELGDTAREVRDEQDPQLSDDALSDRGHFTYIIANSEESLDKEDWREAVRDNAEAAEVYEWWRVSEWLVDKLDAIGVPTLNNCYGTWWGRTCTGQGFLMDGTLQQVAEEFCD